MIHPHSNPRSHSIKLLGHRSKQTLCPVPLIRNFESLNPPQPHILPMGLLAGFGDKLFAEG